CEQLGPPPMSTLFPYTTLFRSADRPRAPAPAQPPAGATPLLDAAGPAGNCRCPARHGADRSPGESPSGRPLGSTGGLRLGDPGRSEEHTSELQSRENLVCRLLL